MGCSAMIILSRRPASIQPYKRVMTAIDTLDQGVDQGANHGVIVSRAWLLAGSTATAACGSGHGNSYFLMAKPSPQSRAF